MVAKKIQADKSMERGDAFASGLIIMLVVNILQRCVGLFRGLGFAHFLTDAELGKWALANSFLVLAVPLAALGFPGSFGKFIEYFRQRGQLAPYIKRAAWITSVGAGLLIAYMGFASEQFSWLVFGSPQSASILFWCAACLLTTIMQSFLVELLIGFRQVKVVSKVHFVQSLTFAVIGVGLVFAVRQWWVLLPSFALGNLVAMVPGVYCLLHKHRGEIKQRPSSLDGLWGRLLPFAVSLWTMNLLANLFEVADRYMLLHMLGDGAEAAVGQYHCARILPNLLISLGLTLGGVLLPYLSQDWEAGRKEAVALRIKQMLQAVSILFVGISVCILVAAPLLFEFVFQGRYAPAQLLLPLALAQAIWVAQYLIAENYLLCAEKEKQLVGLLAGSFAVNLVLNYICIREWGLPGALIATSIAKVAALAVLLWWIQHSGGALGKGSFVLCALPLFLLLGPTLSMLGCALVVLIAGRTDLIFTAEDRRQIDQAVIPRLQKLGIQLESLWPRRARCV